MLDFSSAFAFAANGASIIETLYYQRNFMVVMQNTRWSKKNLNFM